MAGGSLQGCFLLIDHQSMEGGLPDYDLQLPLHRIWGSSSTDHHFLPAMPNDAQKKLTKLVHWVRPRTLKGCSRVTAAHRIHAFNSWFTLLETFRPCLCSSKRTKCYSSYLVLSSLLWIQVGHRRPKEERAWVWICCQGQPTGDCEISHGISCSGYY